LSFIVGGGGGGGGKFVITNKASTTAENISRGRAGDWATASRSDMDLISIPAADEIKDNSRSEVFRRLREVVIVGDEVSEGWGRRSCFIVHMTVSG